MSNYPQYPPHLRTSGGAAVTSEATYFREGDIAGDAEEVILYAPGSASAVITVDGTFTGTITVMGSAESGGTEGGRILFQSGVGSLGRDYFDADGAISKEFRIVSGGDYIIVRGSNWSSGTASIAIHASGNPSTVFVNGPVHTAFDEAVRDSRAFTGGLTPVSATASQVGHIILDNPSGSGKNAFLTARKFGNDNDPADDNIVYQAYVNPTVSTGTWTAGKGANLDVGGASSTVDLYTFVGAAATMGGAGGSGEIRPNGVPYSRDVLAIIRPGVKVGFTVAGSGGGGNAAQISIIFEWYEEDAL